MSSDIHEYINPLLIIIQINVRICKMEKKRLTEISIHWGEVKIRINIFFITNWRKQCCIIFFQTKCISPNKRTVPYGKTSRHYMDQRLEGALTSSPIQSPIPRSTISLCGGRDASSPFSKVKQITSTNWLDWNIRPWRTLYFNEIIKFYKYYRLKYNACLSIMSIEHLSFWQLTW